MATGMKCRMRVGGSRNNKLLKNAKKFAEGKHQETYSELEDINNKLELGDALGEIYKLTTAILRRNRTLDNYIHLQ